MSFATRLRIGRPRAPDAPGTSVAPDDGGFTHRVIEIPLAGPVARPSILGGAVDRIHLPDAAALARHLSSVAPVPRAGLPVQCPAILVDLETTGLNRDAGCIPFMVGMAWHEGDRLVVHQWILARLSAEAAMLADVIGALQVSARAGAAIVTYNGASFDLPLLRARMVRHRLVRPGAATAVDGRPHFDLLVPARRLWQGRVDNCRLGTLERLALSVQRQGDVHGSEIAEAYWDWLRAPENPRHRAVLDRIEAHNRVDLISLAGLAAEIGRRLTCPPTAIDAVRAATHHVRQRRPERAEPILASVLHRDPRPEERAVFQQAALLAADLLRRDGRHTEAAALWARVCHAQPGHPEAHERLAKFLEHQARDPAAALAVADRSTLPCTARRARLARKVAASGAAASATPAVSAVLARWGAPQRAPPEPTVLGFAARLRGSWGSV